MGATVIGTARPDAHDYLRELGATPADDSSEGFDAVLATANADALSALVARARAHAPIAYPNGVEPEPKIDGHPSLAFDGEMSREAFERLNRAIGKSTIPLRIEEFPLDRVVDAHRRIDQGHVEGKVVLRLT